MSGNVDVRIALETALSVMSPALSTAWENIPYTPVSGIPYQKAFLLFAQPDNSEYGEHYREQGIFQITLMYPYGIGTLAAGIRAELIRQKFTRGASFTSDSVTVVVDRTAEIVGGVRDGDRWAVPVKVRWHAQI
jgi:hypothetical protein